jgi:hypothetical protein
LFLQDKTIDPFLGGYTHRKHQDSQGYCEKSQCHTPHFLSI